MINIQEILHEIDLSKAVYLDAVNGVAGTEYPIGTERMPASTLANAKTIAGAIGTKTIVIVDDITLNASVAGYTLVGHAGRREAIVVTLNNQSVEDAIFMDLRVTGQANGDAKYFNCAFTAVTDMTGEAYDCVVVAAATLGLKDGAGTSFRAVGLAFYAGSTLDINGCRDVDIHNKTGDADIDNVNNAGCTLNIEGTGDTQLLASCTAGAINLYGNQRINDASGGSTVNDYTTYSSLTNVDESVGPFSYLDAGGEQDVYEDTSVTRRKISLELDLNAMTENGTVRLYRKVDGTNYRLWIEEAFNAGGDEKVFTREQIVTNQHFKVTYEEDADEGAARSIPYNVITEQKE